MNENVYKKWIPMLWGTLGVLILLTFAAFWYLAKHAGYDKEYIAYAAELRVLNEKIVRHATDAVVNAKVEDFSYLTYRRNEFTGVLEILKRGKQDSAGKITLPPSPKTIQDNELAEISRIWSVEKNNVDIILASQDLILGLPDLSRTLTNAALKIQETANDTIALLVARRNAPGTDFAEISSIIFNAQELEDDMRSLLSVKEDSTEIQRRFKSKVLAFENSITALKMKHQGSEIYPKILDIERANSVIKDRAQDLVMIGEQLAKINAAYRAITGLIPTFIEYTANLERAYAQLYTKRPINNAVTGALGGLTLLALALLFFFMAKDKQISVRQKEEENRRLENEIQQLVAELKDLANGNLAIRVQSNVEVTSAIADAINYALEELRRLVKGINNTSQRVSGSASEVRKITTDLVHAIQEQTQEIMNTTGSVNTMATSIDQVSTNAKKSAQVAENSVQIAHDGAMIVQGTIAGMDRIREQIRDTEKRIRRLGESSVEIGEIVSLIDGISEQTNILSLNASIQAAMAGEAGMGFAVVADEVQQLAVKSSQAAKEVEGIVKAIRADTARATESMERAISEVSTGSKLAHDAGVALGKIEGVSKNLFDLVQGISSAAEEQARMSNRITRMMEIIESIARQTARGTSTTAESIENLALLVRDLHASVAEFKLPEGTYG